MHEVGIYYVDISRLKVNKTLKKKFSRVTCLLFQPTFQTPSERQAYGTTVGASVLQI